MAKTTTAGTLLVNAALPPDLRQESHNLDKKGIQQLLQRVAERYPDKYKEIAGKLMEIGQFSVETTSNSLSLASVDQPLVTRARLGRLREQISEIAGSNLKDAEKDKRIIELVGNDIEQMQNELFDDAIKNQNPLALQAQSGSRGNATSFRQIVAGDGLVEDHLDRIMSVPVLHGYAQGLDPAEYMASAFGARKGSYLTKKSTADAGFMCLSGDTLVRMADGSSKPIVDVAVGDLVTGADRSGNTFPVRVSAVFSHGEREVWRHTFKQGGQGSHGELELLATNDHKVLMAPYAHGPRGAKSAMVVGEFEPTPVGAEGRFIAKLAGKRTVWGMVEEPWALLLGMMIGDGCYTSTVKNSPSFACADVSLIAETADYLRTLGDIELRHRGDVAYGLVQRDRELGECHAFLQKLEELGMERTYAWNKQLPHAAMTAWTRHSVTQLLAGLWATDGFVATSRYRGEPRYVQLGYTCTSSTLVTQIKLLLSYLGIDARMSEERHTTYTHDGVKKYGRPAYAVTVTNRASVERFAALIHIPGVKGKKLAAALQAGSGRSTLQPLSTMAELVSSECVGSLATFDIEVDHPDHLFVLCNGLIVSNSKQLSQAAHRLMVTTEDCGTTNGISIPGADKDLVGSVLSAPVGDFKAGQIITPEMVKRLKDVDEVQVRSALTCTAPEGICARCAGIRDRGALPEVGDAVGIMSAQSVGEKLSQGMLCLAASTRVQLYSPVGRGKLKLIWTLKPGDLVMGSNDVGDRIPRSVIKVHVNGMREVRDYYFRRGLRLIKITATPDHRVLLGWTDPTIGHQFGFAMRPLHECTDVPMKDSALVSTARLLCSVRSKWFGRGLVSREAYATFVRASEPRFEPTYDIEISGPYHLFGIEGGFVVHNSAKHGGGTVSKTGPSTSGFKAINAAVQFTESEDLAPVSPIDGHVTRIEDAPQGGQYIHVGKEKLYVPVGQTALFKRGDQVEAGDILTDGPPNVSDVVRYRGLGDGRLTLMNHLQGVLARSGVKPHRRNLETVVRGLVNHVRITPVDGFDGLMVDDVVPFDRVMRNWEPREGFRRQPVSISHGMYLEKPALHYTIGTRVTPKVAQRLGKAGVTDVDVHQDPPPFEPEPVRVMESALHDEDWMTRLSGSFLTRGFQDSVLRGRESNPRGTSYVPALAQAKDFGRDLPSKGTY